MQPAKPFHLKPTMLSSMDSIAKKVNRMIDFLLKSASHEQFFVALCKLKIFHTEYWPEINIASKGKFPKLYRVLIRKR